MIMRGSAASAARQSCAAERCFATFEGRAAADDETRHCNRSGPDGGHAHHWDGQRWQLVRGRMEYDRA